MRFCHRVGTAHPPSRSDLIVGPGGIVEDTNGDEWCCHSDMNYEDVGRALRLEHGTEGDPLEDYMPIVLEDRVMTDYDIRFGNVDELPDPVDQAFIEEKAAEAEARRLEERERMLKSPKELRYDRLEAGGVFNRLGLERPGNRPPDRGLAGPPA